MFLLTTQIWLWRRQYIDSAEKSNERISSRTSARGRKGKESKWFLSVISTKTLRFPSNGRSAWSRIVGRVPSKPWRPFGSFQDAALWCRTGKDRDRVPRKSSANGRIDEDATSTSVNFLFGETDANGSLLLSNVNLPIIFTFYVRK